MSESDPSATIGNQPPKTVELLSYQCYEGAWRGFTPDFYAIQLPRERVVHWGRNIQVTFDTAEPGVIKEVHVETPEETKRFAGEAGLLEEAEERDMLARVLGIEVGAFSKPSEINPDTLTPEERADYDERDPLYTSGEFFGRQAEIAVTVDAELAQALYDQALAAAQTTRD